MKTSKYSFKEMVGFGQSFYFLITGLWPIIHIQSFVMVSGPKTDLWLVKTLGVLITAVAVPILIASIRKRITSEIILLGLGSALGLGFIDVYYSLNDTISKAYLWDALAETTIIVFWLVAWKKKGK